jgi:hypothetical protein
MRQIISRKELMDILHLSRTHLIRKLKKAGIGPLEHAAYEKKKVYLVSDVEMAFKIKINDDNTYSIVDANGKIQDEKHERNNLLDDISDIIKQ